MGPVTLTKPQFQQLRPQGDYQKYLSFIAARRGGSPQRPQPPQSSPFPTMTPAQQQQELAGIAGLYPALTPQQMASQAAQYVDPEIAAIQQSSAQRSSNAAQLIRAATADYATQLAQLGSTFATPYQTAAPQQAAIDAALQQSLTGGGSSLASGLSNELSQLQGTSGASAVQQAAGALSSQGASSGNTALANGSASLSDLLANAAAAGSFGAKLPAIGQLAGLQQTGNALGQIQSGEQTQLQNAENARQSYLAQLQSENAQNARSRASALTSAENEIRNYNLSATKADVSAGQSQARLNLEAKKAAQNAVNQDRNYQLSLARVGIQQKSLQLRAAELDYKLANGGFTPTQVTKFSGTLEQGIATMPAGTTYSAFVKQAVVKGVPLSLAIEAANQHWSGTARPAPGDIASIVGATQADVNATGFPQQLKDYKKMTGATAPQQYALTQLPKYGWDTPSESAALNALWTRESGWSPTAVNPKSGAKGIPQELGHTVPASYDTDPRVQITWGLNYIKQRYGSPAAAWAHEQQFGWY
ncbi:MAG TPA: hypothetical protein VFW41_11835 [Gaiellaceae bacterium]|nr:hypothetical protein [Gaiellaceae bacterium]